MKVIKIMMAMFVSVCLANDVQTHFNNTLDIQNFSYYKIGEDILNTAKNIFNVFHLKKYLTESPRIRMLLTMHNGLNKIIQTNYETYEEIKNISKVSTDTKNMSRYLDLNGVTAMLYVIRLQKFKKNKTAHITQNQSEDNITANFEDDKELINIVNNFAAKISTLTVNDLFKPSNYSSHNKTFMSKRNLKYWRPETKNEERYRSNNVSRRIYKGQTVKANKYSFMAGIHVDDRFVCSGSMISLNLVITAANCLKFEQIKRGSAFVHIGSDYLKKGGMFIPIVQVYFHPLFNPKNLRNNLAIVKMKSTWYDRKKIKRIKLDTKNTSLLVNDDYQIVVLGWGSTDESKTFEATQQLKTAKLDVYSLVECTNIYSSQYVTEKHFCAGFTTKGGGACNKDVGGPGIKNGVLVGVISFGPAVCGNANEPTVFLRIGSYIGWITEIINQAGETTKSHKSTEKSAIHYKNENVPTTTPKMKNYYQKEKSDHINARDEAISIVKEIINEIMLTSDDKLDETLYKDLYEDFNELYLKSVKKDFEELDESIDVLAESSVENFEYIETTTLLNEAATDADKFQDVVTTPKVDISYQNPLLDKESDTSTDTSDSDEESDNYDDRSGLDIDIPNTEDESMKHSESRNNRINQHKTTDIWGLQDVFFFWDIQDKKIHKNFHSVSRFTTKLRPLSIESERNATDTQTDVYIGKDISDENNDYDDEASENRQRPVERAGHITQMY